MKSSFFLILALLTFSGIAQASYEENSYSYASTYKTVVDGKGNISVAPNFQLTWVFIGAWSIADTDVNNVEANGHSAASLHNVYTQPGVVEYYRKHGSFPDGAVFIKELFKTVTTSMTTGTVSRAGETEGWFVMVKDTENRFLESPLWGDGWGWALIKPDSKKSVTKNYKTECLGCHIPAKQNDWIYVDGYPTFSETKKY